ncbi:MAG: peptide chain release factor 1 [Myxococcales bacterium]|nr:peptide chain release factor 1 [Myxococcales bacterium]
MFERFAAVLARYDELGEALATPEIACDPERSVKLLRERAGIEQTALALRTWQDLLRQIDEAQTIATEETDADLRQFARDEAATLRAQADALEAQLKELMVPRDPRDGANVVLEVRAGTGGEEAALFAADLLRMYARFAEKRGFRVEVLSESEAAQGGLKEVVALIAGHGAYSVFKHESGTHRVQRVPATEAQGRIHTSACTVAVLPEVEDVEVDIRTEDLRIDTYRAGGAGGQHVNRTDSAVRITHLPSGIVVQCQDERSQHKNKSKAMLQLRAKLYDQQQRAAHATMAASRKEQVGSGDRSERIRTYNFPQNRLTDHRIGLTLHSLDLVMEGDLDNVVNALFAAERARKMAESQIAN